MEKRLLDTTCISCGNCVGACPTGAITEKLPFPKPGPWASEKVESVCSFCSIGCNLSYKVFSDHTFTVQNVNGTSHNKGYLCSKGRWGYRYMLEGERLLTPSIKKKGVHAQATWGEAFDHAANRLKSIISAHGPESVAVFGSPRMTNEELYLLQKLVRTGLKTNNIGSFSNLLNGVEQDGLDDTFGITASTTTMDELRKCDVALVINADLAEENLIAELKVKAAQRRGARLVTINSSEISLNKFSDLWIDAKRGTNTVLINGISRALIEKGAVDKDFVEKRTEGFAAFKDSVAGMDINTVSSVTGVDAEKLTALFDLLTKPDLNVIVLYSIDSLWEKSKNDLKAIGNLMMLSGRIGKPGNGIIILRDFSNSQGLFDMGADPRYLPGNVPLWDTSRIKGLGEKWGVDLAGVFKPVDLKAEMEKDRIKAILIFGEDPLRETANLGLTGGAEFVLVVDTAMTATAQEAEVVLPASLPVETSGTLTSCDRRVQRSNKVFEPPQGMENWQIIAKLAERLGMAAPYKSADDISVEIGKANPAYQGLANGAFWGKDFLKEQFMTADGKGKFGDQPAGVAPISVDKKPYLYSEKYFEVKVRGKLRE
jgi:predicted molibdopterin-dependent oxidoreductase YjgC